MRLFHALPLVAAMAALPLSKAHAEDWSALLLDRTVTIFVPEVFSADPAFSDASSGSAIVEFLPPGEDVGAWSQMLSLTGFDDGSDLPADQAVLGIANNIAQGYSAACPTSFAAEDLSAPAIPGAEAVFAAWLACGDAGGNGQSEAMVVLVIAVGGTVYTAQWAERGAATVGPPAFDMTHWLPRLDALMQLQL